MLLSLLKVEGHSMEPTIKEGSTVLATSVPYLFIKPQTGDMVVFKKKKKLFLKRINETRDDKFFVVGDNKSDSLDSKKFGWINKKDIIGKVIIKF